MFIFYGNTRVSFIMSQHNGVDCIKIKKFVK